MKKTISFILFLFTIAISLGLNSCSESNCALGTVPAAHFDFLSSDKHQPLALTSEITVSASTMIRDSIEYDTIYNAISNINSLSLPLSYSTKTTYIIHYTDLLMDKIEVTHRPIPFVSEIECGVLIFHEIEDIQYTTNALDSIVIVNKEITNEERTNFHIYYTIAE